MKRKKIWLQKIAAAALCVTMAAEPAAIYAEDFSDGFYGEELPEATQDSPQTENSGSIQGEKGEEIDIARFEGEEQGNIPDQQEFFDEDFCEAGSLAETNGETLGGTCGENVTWSLQDGVLTIEGNGPMDDFLTVKDWFTGEIIESHPQPWEDYSYNIREVYIKDGVTTVGDRSFSDCYYLKKSVIGNSVKNIGEYAFANDNALTDITIGNSVESIELDALYGIGIKKLVLPASLKTIDGYSLLALWELEEIEMPDNGIYKSIDGVLYKDNGDTLFLFPPKREGEYTIPGYVTKISDNAFSYSSLTKIVIPDNVKEIGRSAFDYNEKLTTIIFGRGITKIPDSCCHYDRALTTVVIPEGITSIGSGAFWWCTSLESVTLPSTVTEINNSFESSTSVTLLNPEIQKRADGSYVSGVLVNVTATENYKNAFEVLELVNKERAQNGVAPLVMDTSLLETAMLRGFENVLYWSHTRPGGDDCFTADNLMMGENIAWGQGSPESVMRSWMNSSDHRANILSARFTTIGVGCVTHQGRIYWVQCFGEEGSSEAVEGSCVDRVNSRSILVKKDSEYYRASLSVGKTELKEGEETSVKVLWNDSTLENSGAVIKSSNTSVCKVENGKLIAVSAGTADITMYFEGYQEAAVTKRVKVNPKTASTPVSKNIKITFNGNKGNVSPTSKTLASGSEIGRLPSPKREGYSFVGWYTAKSGGKKVTASTKITKKCTLYAHWTKVSVAKGEITKLTNVKGKKMEISLQKIKGASGYQIVYAANEKFSAAKSKTTAKTTLTLSGLIKNKTYYVKVRAYIKDSAGKKVYGAYSTVKKIKIKK